jgi:uncharacterized protein (DUF427 family)
MEFLALYPRNGGAAVGLLRDAAGKQHMMWAFRGSDRPDFADEPGPGQESVWDYPRPPALVECTARVRVIADNAVIADTCHALRVLETASPPTFYIPPGDIDFTRLADAPGSSFCEWKGRANYYALARGGPVIGWQYRHPTDDFQRIAGYLSFYPGRVACWVDGERVRAQAGDFYGGWVTDAITGPFKGDPGTGHW